MERASIIFTLWREKMNRNQLWWAMQEGEQWAIAAGGGEEWLDLRSLLKAEANDLLIGWEWEMRERPEYLWPEQLCGWQNQIRGMETKGSLRHFIWGVLGHLVVFSFLSLVNWNVVLCHFQNKMNSCSWEDIMVSVNWTRRKWSSPISCVERPGYSPRSVATQSTYLAEFLCAFFSLRLFLRRICPGNLFAS